MDRPGTAREALIAEAIGDVARLLDRAKALQPLMLESSQGARRRSSGPCNGSPCRCRAWCRRWSSVGAVADACGDCGGRIGRHLGTACVPVVAVSAGDDSRMCSVVIILELVAHGDNDDVRRILDLEQCDVT
jgi:hypothetical protein